jgi:hypothetical protein
MEQAGGCSSSIRYLSTIRGVQASRCSHEQTLTELVDARRASAILVDMEGCAVVSRGSQNLFHALRSCPLVLNFTYI